MGEPRIAIYPSSANPPTWGHANILQRSVACFDHIYWAAAYNPEKKYIFSAEERKQMMMEYVHHFQLTNVTIDMFSGSTVRYAQQKKAKVLIKGLRNESDFHAELQQFVGNKGIDSTIETFCLFGVPELSVVSSSLVRELAMLGENIESYVHPAVAKLVLQILKRSSTI